MFYTFFHCGGWLAGRARDNRRYHTVIILEVYEGRGVPAGRHIRDGPLRRHRPRHRDRRREQREIRRRYHARHRADRWVREDLLESREIVLGFCLNLLLFSGRKVYFYAY